MARIEPISEGSLAKSKKTNEVIRLLNSVLNMTVREGGSSESPRLVVSESSCELITTSGGDGLPEGYVETAVILCVDGAPLNGSILFKAD